MELRIDRNGLFKEVQKIQNITPLKGTKPILSCFLIETSEGGIYLYATDLNMGTKIFVCADVVVPGKVCLPAKVVYDILRELPEDTSLDIVLEDNNRLRFSCLNSLFHVPSVEPTEFPAFPQFDITRMYSIPLDRIIEMFVKINIAVPFTEQKLYGAPAGALFAIDDNGIEMAGTDGLRMAYMRLEGIKLPIRLTTVLPKKLLDETPKILTDWSKGKEEGSGKEGMEADTKIGLTENHIVFSWPNTQVFARLLENKFPGYKEHISVKNDKVIVLDRERFRQAVRRVSLISERKEWFILIKLTPGKFFLDSKNVEVGDAHDEIEIDYHGESMDIGFNPRYILDFLSVIDTEKVSLEMSNNESLAILKPKDEENIKFIIMPVRL